MFAISARERDMLEMLRELSAYERDFFHKKHWRQCMRCARSIGKAARRGSCSAICRLSDGQRCVHWTMTAQRIRCAIVPAAREAEFCRGDVERGAGSPCIPRALCSGGAGRGRALHGEIGDFCAGRSELCPPPVSGAGPVPPGHDQPQRIQRYGARGRRTAVYRRCHRRAPGGYGHRASVTDMIK